MRQFAPIFSLLFSIATYGETEIRDPSGILTQVNQHISKRSFQEAFVCKEEAVYDYHVERCEIGCDQGFCATICFSRPAVVTQSVAQCEGGLAKIYADNGSILEMSEVRYNELSGNLGTDFLLKLEDFLNYRGYVTINRYELTTFKTNPSDPNSKAHNVINLYGEFTLEETPGRADFILTIGRDLTAVGQVIRFRIGGNTWFRLKDLRPGGKK